MGHAFARLTRGNADLLEGSIARKERIDQDAARSEIDPKAGMAEPRDLHAFHPLMQLK